MKQAIEILRDAERLLIQADLRVAMNEELDDPTNNPQTALEILELQKELEAVHAMTNKIQNTLTNKINQALHRQIKVLRNKLEDQEQ